MLDGWVAAVPCKCQVVFSCVLSSLVTVPSSVKFVTTSHVSPCKRFCCACFKIFVKSTRNKPYHSPPTEHLPFLENMLNKRFDVQISAVTAFRNAFDSRKGVVPSTLQSSTTDVGTARTQHLNLTMFHCFQNETLSLTSAKRSSS